MTITEMLGQSLLLTVLGMGVVFLFLVIMIFFMTLSSKIIRALKLDKEEKPAQTAAPVQKAQDQGAIVAAIAAAIHDKTLKA
ncbi:MAG: OadG family protein [Treponemataceae bacterium]|nr:OadG family protein [Treponemataceae bacterium]